MTDRELLELAAKAAGIDERRLPHAWPDRFDLSLWNPLADDGDALRLAVKLGIPRCFALEFGPGGVCATFQHPVVGADEFTPMSGDFDPYAAARRVITRAAAEIGRAMG